MEPDSRRLTQEFKGARVVENKDVQTVDQTCSRAIEFVIAWKYGMEYSIHSGRVFSLNCYRIELVVHMCLAAAAAAAAVSRLSHSTTYSVLSDPIEQQIPDTN